MKFIASSLFHARLLAFVPAALVVGDVVQLNQLNDTIELLPLVRVRSNGLRNACQAVVVLVGALLAAGCVSTKYKSAAKNTPPAQVLNLLTAEPPIQVVLNTVIAF